MKPWRAIAFACLCGLSTPVLGDVVNPCEEVFILPTPLHPSSSERIGLRQHMMGPFTFGAWARATVANGIIDVDIIETDDLTPLPGYRRVADVLQDVLGYVGPLAPGVYAIHAADRRDLGNGLVTLCELRGSVDVATSAAPVVLLDAIEYYNAARDRYFLTADAAEIDYLDRGGEAGWSRTGQTFKVFDNAHADGRGDSVCRSVSPPGSGLDAHFLTVDYYECFFLANSPVWLPEVSPFHIGNPDWRTGECADRMIPVFRLWNPRNGDHRLISDAALRATLESQGWVAEGKGGGVAVAMCAPLS